jgi:two-component system, sensor histidine kinase and response regulator
MNPTPLAQLLIVDDEAALVRALCQTLQGEGYATLGLTSPTHALEALQRQSFDVLIADLMMPGMDGIALLRAAHDIDPQLVGIMMTGHGTIDTAVAAMKAGALDYILKPFDLTVILPVLARALSVRRLRLENAALLARVAERTQALEATVGDLRRANQELDAFAHSVAHDLRAPLRVIDGLAQMLHEDFAASWPAEAQSHLGTLLASAGKLSALIDDLLRLARVTRQALMKQPVKITALVEEVARELQGSLLDRNVRLQVAELPDAYADPALLRQVLVNLFSNALKFTQNRPEPRIDIQGEHSGCECLYCISDNGVGFDMHHAEKLFGVFQRLHGAEEFEGTGIGLSIVRRIVERHGGRVWAEGEPNRGARFYFALPDAECAPQLARRTLRRDDRPK